MVTIFFRLQRKLVGKNYLFKNSCPEKITPPIPLDKSSLGHFSRPSLIPETKREQSLLKSYSNHFSQLVFINKFGKENYVISCLFGYMYVSMCVFVLFCFFFLDKIAAAEISL